jgi:hypothetical protein
MNPSKNSPMNPRRAGREGVVMVMSPQKNDKELRAGSGLQNAGLGFLWA